MPACLNNFSFAIAATCAALLAFAGFAAAEESTFTPLYNSTSECNTEDNPGEWFRPDLGAVADVIPLKTRLYATKESVTGGTAMKLVFEKGSKGLICWEKSNKETKGAGFTFYAKASKPMKVKICTNPNQDVKAVADVGVEWKKFDFPFADIGYTNDWWQIMIKVVDPIDEHCTLIIDRLGVEGPAFIANPKIEPKPGPDDKISSKDLVYGAEHLAKTLANLKAKKPFKVFALGDSITAGAQTMRSSWAIKVPETVPFRYFGTMARIWEEEYGYKGITPVDCGHGGWTAAQLLTVVEADVLSKCGPDDLVIIQAGGNDINGGATVEQWKTDTKALIAKVRTKTDQIILVDTTINLKGKVAEQAENISKGLQALVADEKVAGCDMTKLFIYRGLPFACGFLANDFHPDIVGHIMIGEMLAPILTGKHRTFPE